MPLLDDEGLTAHSAGAPQQCSQRELQRPAWYVWEVRKPLRKTEPIHRHSAHAFLENEFTRVPNCKHCFFFISASEQQVFVWYGTLKVLFYFSKFLTSGFPSSTYLMPKLWANGSISWENQCNRVVWCCWATPVDGVLTSQPVALALRWSPN